MSDIDFEELDRAVNGAISSNDAPEDATITRVERTSLSSVAPSPASSTSSAPASTAPAARRSSGRFMDMVHPSSDMRSRTAGPITSSRPQPAPQAPVEPVTPQQPEVPAWNEPLESPFLPDAKVEKRPLGGGEVATPEAAAIIDGFDFQGLLDEPDEELLEAPEAQELIEATASPDPVTPIDFASATPDVEIIEESKELEAFEAFPVEAEAELPQPIAEAPKPVVEEPIGPTSITPQYKEQASSNQESGAMYDTESYHLAVAAPEKKKSGWATVIWILLLVIVGAAGGWAVFTYVVPLL